MSEFGRPGEQEPTRGDWWRYGWLFVLASMVLVLLFSRQRGTFVILLAVYLLAGAGAAVFVLARRSRS